MKIKLLAWSLIAMTVIGCTNSKMPEVGDDNSNVNQENHPPLTFAVISDIHFGNNVNEGPLVKVPKALKNITSYGELDAMVVVGDLTEGGTVQQYQQLLKTFKDTTLFTNPVNELFFLMGNHDNYDTNGKSNYQTYLKSYNNGEPYPFLNYQVIKGYPFITVSTFSSRNSDIDAPLYGMLAYPTETVNWLEENMEKASQECPGKPIFVFTHVPPRWTCYSSWTEHENGVSWCMQVLNPVLNKYPQAVVFAGHSHYPIGDPRSIHQGANPNSTRQNYYTVINTASTTYSEIHENAVDEGPHPEKHGYVTEGLIIHELANGDIEIRRYDTYRNEEIAADKRWVLKAPFDGSQFTYADIRDADDNPLNKNLYGGGEAPKFKEDATMTLVAGSTAVKVTFPQASDDDCVFRYSLKVYNASSKTCVSTAHVFSQFYLNSDMPKVLSHTVGGLQAKTDYYIEVRALDSYDNASDPIVTSFTTR